jgi:hypothetical protein
VALIVYLIAPALVTLATRHEPFALAVFTTLAAATVAIGWRTGAATAAVPAAGILDARAFAGGDRLASHDPKPMNVIIGVETVDHPSDAQLVANARKYFKATDRMQPQKP